MSIFFSDAMGSLGNKWGPIVVEGGLKLNLVHVTAVPPWINTIEETLAEIEKFKKMILNQPNLKLVLNQKDLSLAVADGKLAVVLGMKNTPIDILNEGAISKLRKAGISIISPCHDKQNDLGSGWLNTDIELTRWGKFFLKRCAEKGIIVDLSTCGHKMARDIISYATSYKKDEIKLMVSNVGCYSQYHHIRNLPDDVLKPMAELGGIVGITTRTFTNDERDNSIFPFKSHLSHAINLCGADLVCVGSDDVYITRNVEESQKQFKGMSIKLDPIDTQGTRFPDNPIAVMGPDMLEKLFKFCLPYFPVGISEKIFGGNLLDFFKRALPS